MHGLLPVCAVDDVVELVAHEQQKLVARSERGVNCVVFVRA